LRLARTPREFYRDLVSAGEKRLHSVESRALTHLESIDLGNATFISMGGPQAHGNSQPRRTLPWGLSDYNKSV
jgi:hypothetical protein